MEDTGSINVKWELLKEQQDQKRTARGAKNKVTLKRGCTLPCDYLSSKEKEKQKLNVEVEVMNMRSKISWDDFCKLPDDLKKEYLMTLATCVKICHNGKAHCYGCPIDNDPKGNCDEKNTELANKVLSIFDSDKLFVMTKSFGVVGTERFLVNGIYKFDKIDTTLWGEEYYYVFDHNGNSVNIGREAFFKEHFRPLRIGDHVVMGASGTKKYAITSEGWKGTIAEFSMICQSKVNVKASFEETDTIYDLDAIDLCIDPCPDCKPRFANGLYEALEASEGITKGKYYMFTDEFATDDRDEVIDNIGHPFLETSKRFIQAWKKVEFVGPEKDGIYLYTGNKDRNSNTWVEIKNGLRIDYKHTRRPVTISELQDDYIPSKDVELMNGYYVFHDTGDAKYSGFTDKHVYLFYEGTIDKDDQNRTRFNERLTNGFGPIPKNPDLQHPVQRKFVEHFKPLEVGMLVKRHHPRPVDPSHYLVYEVEAINCNLPSVQMTRGDAHVVIPGSILMVVDEPEKKMGEPINGLYVSTDTGDHDTLIFNHVYLFSDGRTIDSKGRQCPRSYSVPVCEDALDAWRLRPLKVGDHIVMNGKADDECALTRKGWKGVVTDIRPSGSCTIRDSFPASNDNTREFSLRHTLFELDPEPEKEPAFAHGYFKFIGKNLRGIPVGEYVRFNKGVARNEDGEDLNFDVRLLNSGISEFEKNAACKYVGPELPKDGLLNGWFRYTGPSVDGAVIDEDELVHFVDGQFKLYGTDKLYPMLGGPIPRDVTARNKNQKNYMKLFSPVPGSAFDVGDKVVRRAEISSSKTNLKMGVVYEVRHIYSSGKIVLHPEGAEAIVQVWAVIGEIVKLDISKITGVYVYTGTISDDGIIQKGIVYRFSNGYTRVPHKGSAVVWPSDDSSIPGGIPEASRLVVYGFLNEGPCERLNGEFTGPNTGVTIKLDGIGNVPLGRNEKYTVTKGTLYNSKMEQVNIGGIIWANGAYRNKNVKRIMEWLTPIKNDADGKYVFTGMSMCSDGRTGSSVTKYGFTVGKIYEVKNGVMIDDDGATRPSTGNRWSAETWNKAGFTKIKE